MKARELSNEEKGSVFRSYNKIIKFASIINQDKIKEEIFLNKKNKQRYLDYAYKIGLKKCFENLIRRKKINVNDEISIHIYVDEHNLSTSGRYELKESLLQEFKEGTINFKYGIFHKPIFKNIVYLDLGYKNSKNNCLIRAADILANKIYTSYRDNINIDILKNKVYITELP